MRQRRRGDRDRKDDGRGKLAKAHLVHAYASHLPALIKRVDGVRQRGHDDRKRAEKVA